MILAKDFSVEGVVLGGVIIALGKCESCDACVWGVDLIGIGIKDWDLWLAGLLFNRWWVGE